MKQAAAKGFWTLANEAWNEMMAEGPSGSNTNTSGREAWVPLRNQHEGRPRRHVTYKEMKKRTKTRNMIKTHDDPKEMMEDLFDTFHDNGKYKGKAKRKWDVIRIDDGRYRTIAQHHGEKAGRYLGFENLKAGHTTLVKRDHERVVFAGEIIIDLKKLVDVDADDDDVIVINTNSGHYAPRLESARKQMGKRLKKYLDE